MSSSLRDWYLGALGVVRYVPRDPLQEDVADGAGDARFDTATRDADTSGAGESPQSVQVREQLRPEAPGSRDSTPGPSSGQQAMAAAPLPASAAGNSGESVSEASREAVSFRLGFWQPSPELVVFSDMPLTARVTDAHREMLANLLKAIGQLGGALPAVELIDWPQTRAVSGDLRGAREFVDVFVQVKHRLQPFTTVLLMGSLTARIVGGSEAPVGTRVSMALQAEGIVTHSLHEMVADTALKRPTWEAIRHLAKTS